MEFFERHKLIAVTLLIQLIALPLLLILTRQPQDQRSHALISTSLFFMPRTSETSPLALDPSEYFSVDIMLEPGEFLIPGAQIEIFYDATKLKLVDKTPVSVNSTSFPKSKVSFSKKPGQITLLVNVADATKSIGTTTKVATIYFKALSPAERTFIYFGDSTKIFHVDGTSGFFSGNPEVITVSTPSAQAQTTGFPKFNWVKKK